MSARTRDDEPQDQSTEHEADAPAEAEVPEVETDPVTELEQQVGELKEQLLRQRADFENARKRFRREAEEAGQRAIARFARPILGELDNFDRALQAANPEQFQEFAMGVSMIKSNLDNVLGDYGLEKIPCEGVFDPALHEVIQEVEDADQPRGTIVSVERVGYRLGNQVVRSAQVVVSRPPADASTADDADAQAEASERAEDGDS